MKDKVQKNNTTGWKTQSKIEAVQFGGLVVFKSKVRLNSFQLCNLESVLFYCMSNSYHEGNARTHCTGFLYEVSEIIPENHSGQIYLIKGAPKC